MGKQIEFGGKAREKILQGVDILADTVIRIFDDCPNVYGIKEATGSLDRVVELLSQRPDIKILSGDVSEIITIKN